MDLQQRFKSSSQYEQLQDEVMKWLDESSTGEKIEEYVERMILSDLESNPGLVKALGHEGTMDPVKTMKVLGARIAREVENGSAGQPIDDFVKTNEDALLDMAKARIRRM